MAVRALLLLLEELLLVLTTCSRPSCGDCPVLLFLHGRGGVKSEGNVRGQSLTRMLLTKAEFVAQREHIVIMPVSRQPGAALAPLPLRMATYCLY